MTPEEIKKSLPSGATHKTGGAYVKNLRENTPMDSAFNDGYIYAYDFWDGKRWQGCACRAVDFFRIKPLP
jgi:hypothetical protein